MRWYTIYDDDDHEPFVIGEHPSKEYADDLAGRYPQTLVVPAAASEAFAHAPAISEIARRYLTPILRWQQGDDRAQREYSAHHRARFEVEAALEAISDNEVLHVDQTS